MDISFLWFIKRVSASKQQTSVSLGNEEPKGHEKRGENNRSPQKVKQGGVKKAFGQNTNLAPPPRIQMAKLSETVKKSVENLWLWFFLHFRPKENKQIQQQPVMIRKTWPEGEIFLCPCEAMDIFEEKVKSPHVKQPPIHNFGGGVKWLVASPSKRGGCFWGKT